MHINEVMFIMSSARTISSMAPRTGGRSCMSFYGIRIIFQMAYCSFFIPTKKIELLQYLRRELALIKVRYQYLISLSNAEFYKSERDLMEPDQNSITVFVFSVASVLIIEEIESFYLVQSFERHIRCYSIVLGFGYLKRNTEVIPAMTMIAEQVSSHSTFTLIIFNPYYEVNSKTKKPCNKVIRLIPPVRNNYDLLTQIIRHPFEYLYERNNLVALPVWLYNVIETYAVLKSDECVEMN